jgi:hypothetical protein
VQGFLTLETGNSGEALLQRPSLAGPERSKATTASRAQDDWQLCPGTGGKLVKGMQAQLFSPFQAAFKISPWRAPPHDHLHRSLCPQPPAVVCSTYHRLSKFSTIQPRTGTRERAEEV